jgi:hypothetical protein
VTLPSGAQNAQLRVSLKTGGEAFHDESIRLVFTGSGRFLLNGFTLAYQVLPGDKRRFQ